MKMQILKSRYFFLPCMGGLRTTTTYQDNSIISDFDTFKIVQFSDKVVDYIYYIYIQ